jgi:hypothetical protein
MKSVQYLYVEFPGSFQCYVFGQVFEFLVTGLHEHKELVHLLAKKTKFKISNDCSNYKNKAPV